MKPCIVCGEPSTESRCEEHVKRGRTDSQRAKRPKNRSRGSGYTHTWDKLSRRARRIQPWCSDCGAKEDLQCDHTPAAWERHDDGLAIRLQDVDVVCGPCNRARGAARGGGQGYATPHGGIAVQAQSRLRMIPNSEGGEDDGSEGRSQGQA